MSCRARLAEWFAAALSALDVAPRVAAALPAGAHWRGRRVLLIAFGKAARPMARAALRQLAGATVRGLLVPPLPDGTPLPPLEVIAGGHPLPTAGSVAAAARALELCRSAGGDEQVLFLVSGGGSALLEQPLDPAVPLGELAALYRALIGCGAPIGEVNTVRRHLSAVKGGRLAAAAAAAAELRTLLVADVPARAGLAAIASGPTCPSASTHAGCLRILERHRLLAAVPAALRARLLQGALPPPVPPGHPVFARSRHEVLLANEDGVRALAAAAAADGVHVEMDEATDDWPCERAADHLLARLRALAAERPGGPVAVCAGGELSVRLPPDAGRGGRNQQFALCCALRIAGEPIAVLSGGTDGVDGNSPAAGAVADGTTAARALAAGRDPRGHLRRGDAFPLFEALGDALHTGPTGTNVRDLRLLVHGLP